MFVKRFPMSTYWLRSTERHCLLPCLCACVRACVRACLRASLLPRTDRSKSGSPCDGTPVWNSGAGFRAFGDQNEALIAGLIEVLGIDNEATFLQLTANFRLPQTVLRLEQALVRLLEENYPKTLDSLEHEVAFVPGLPPLYFPEQNFDEVLLSC